MFATELLRLNMSSMLKEKHELVHDEKAEPVRAAVHACELARAVRMRERGPRAGKSAVRESLPHPS